MKLRLLMNYSGKKKLNAVMISGKKEYETGQTVEYSIDKSNLYEIKS